MLGVLELLFKNLTINSRNDLMKTFQLGTFSVRHKKIFVELPKPGELYLKRKVIYPEKYTVKPLDNIHLGGRDIKTGRIVHKALGGGIKHKYHWIKYFRDGPTTNVPPQEEKVIHIMKCGCRTADVALVAVGDQMKYILATENMKAGDVIRTSRYLPKLPVRAFEGDAYPVGALPIGTVIHNLEIFPHKQKTVIRAAGTCGRITKHLNKMVVVQLPSKAEYAVNPNCVATVGRLSNIEHGSTPIGSAQRNRELGNRPRSGLWQRKTGRHGRKIKPLPRMKVLIGELPEPTKFLRFHTNSIPHHT